MLATRRTILCILSLLLLRTALGAQEISGDHLFQYVQGIAGKNPEGRREFVRSALSGMGIPFRVLPFDTTIERRGTKRRVIGENIVVTTGTGPRAYYVGAHMDAVPGSPGANDNGGGVAVLLGLIRTFKDIPTNSTVSWCFFDQEEVGLIGSAVFARTEVDRREFKAMVNMDVVGWGDELYIGPAGGGDDDFILPALKQAANHEKLTLYTEEFYPPSDNLSFARAGLENISVSIVPAGDVPKLVAMMGGPGADSTGSPRVMETMHTPNDKPETVRPVALHAVYTLLRQTVVELHKTE